MLLWYTSCLQAVTAKLSGLGLPRRATGWRTTGAHRRRAHAGRGGGAARAREAAARAVVLEMIGDLPEADAKPPSDMLFVCKLNPVTTEEARRTCIWSLMGT